MLDLDAIERRLNTGNAPSISMHYSDAIGLIVELRKCRAAMRSVQVVVGVGGNLSQAAYDVLDEALRGAK